MALAQDELLALARLLGFGDPDEVRAVFDLLPFERYRKFELSKGDGRKRTIHAPHPKLKALQRRVLERLLYRASVSPLAHGFVPGRSVVTQARVHAETARALLSLDLEDAYPSVGEGRVRRTLEWTLGPMLAVQYPPRRPEPWRASPGGSPRPTPRAQWATVHGDLVARLCRALASLLCHEGRLPQGAPTSGAVLNLVCARLDRLCLELVLAERASLADLRYTRYADDLTFTASVPIPATFEEKAREAVRRAGFRVNRRKTHLATDAAEDLVICGVRITRSRELSLPRASLRRLRALFHGVAVLEPAAVDEAARHDVLGALGWLTMVTPCCPALLAGPLGALVARHGSWLRTPARLAARGRLGVGPYE